MISTCISLCMHDSDTNQCQGCGRTVLEKLKWKDPATTDDWKLENIEECKNRLTPVQLDYWQKSYEFKLEHGTSMHKYGKTVRNEI